MLQCVHHPPQDEMQSWRLNAAQQSKVWHCFWVQLGHNEQQKRFLPSMRHKVEDLLSGWPVAGHLESYSCKQTMNISFRRASKLNFAISLRLSSQYQHACGMKSWHNSVIRDRAVAISLPVNIGLLQARDSRGMQLWVSTTEGWAYEVWEKTWVP